MRPERAASLGKRIDKPTLGRYSEGPIEGGGSRRGGDRPESAGARGDREAAHRRDCPPRGRDRRYLHTKPPRAANRRASLAAPRGGEGVRAQAYLRDLREAPRGGRSLLPSHRSN